MARSAGNVVVHEYSDRLGRGGRDGPMPGLQLLGRSDVLVPRLGLGAMTWGEAHGLARLHPAKIAYGGAEGRTEETAAWEASIAAGVTLFDTAAMYAGGASERRLGELASDQALIATKFPATPWATADDMPRQLADSLSRLRRDHVDVYQHHFPSRRVETSRLMDLMADAVAAGQVRAVGVSNYSAEQMRQAHAALALRGVPLASNQVEYSLLHRRPETNGVLEACRELGVTLIAYQPLASGALTGKYLDGPRPKGLRRLQPAFRRAERFIYAENQFLWSPEIARVLRDKLTDPPSPDFRMLFVLPANPKSGNDDTRGVLAELIDADDDSGRILACALYARSGPRADPIYVHAKIAVVDDRWLTLGSANLNEHSLFNDSEMNVVAHDPDLARLTRQRLWGEHLELPQEQIPDDPIRAIDDLWKPISKEQLDRRSDGLPLTHRLVRLPNVSKRSRRILGPADSLVVDG